MADSSSNSNDLSTVLVTAGLAAVATRIWTLFKDLDKSSDQATFIQQQAEVQKLFSYATACAQRGDFNQAVQVFSQILQKVPNHAPTYNSIAWIYASHNYQLDQALAFANKGVELAGSPLQKALHLDTVSEVYARRGEFETAATLSHQFLNLMTSLGQVVSSPVTYFRLAWYYQSNQDFDKARAFLQQAAKTSVWGAAEYLVAGDICYAIASGWFCKSLYFEAVNQYDIASAQYRSAIQRAVNNESLVTTLRFKLSACLNDKGMTLYLQDDYTNSHLLYQEAYQICPTNPYPMINLAHIAAKDGNKILMRQWLEKGIPLVNDSPNWVHKDRLIAYMLDDLEFEPYQHDILDILFSNEKITMNDYKRFLKTREARSNKDKHPVNFSQQNFYSSVTGVAGSVEGNFIYQSQ